MTPLNDLPGNIKSRLIKKVLTTPVNYSEIVKWLFDAHGIETRGVEVAKFRLFILKNPEDQSTPLTQLDKVNCALLKRDPVNSVTMFNEGIPRLSAIIKRLRDRGYPIITKCDNGNGLAHYSLPENWQPKPPPSGIPDTKKPV